MQSGRYDLTRLDECVRLVLSAKPNGQHQTAVLAVIERTPGTPSREDVLQALSGNTHADR
jgi:hypothetical protein